MSPDKEVKTAILGLMEQQKLLSALILKTTEYPGLSREKRESVIRAGLMAYGVLHTQPESFWARYGETLATCTDLESFIRGLLYITREEATCLN